MNQFYQGLSNTTLIREPGSQFEYSTFGMILLDHILSLKVGIPYEQLVSDKILKVMGMDIQKLYLLPKISKQDSLRVIKTVRRFQPLQYPDVFAGGGVFRSTANVMLKYVSVNLGLIHTKVNESTQFSHLIRESTPAINQFNYREYTGLGWRILTNFGTETITHGVRSMVTIRLLDLLLPNILVL